MSRVSLYNGRVYRAVVLLGSGVCSVEFRLSRILKRALKEIGILPNFSILRVVLSSRLRQGGELVWVRFQEFESERLLRIDHLGGGGVWCKTHWTLDKGKYHNQ